MQAFILVGDSQKQKEHVNRFSEENAIRLFNAHWFSEFKILDARNLKKLLAKKLPAGEKQLVVIENPTVEAQHAILKTIEELREETYVFFLSNTRDAFLPTIHSRCSVISLEMTPDTKPVISEAEIERLFTTKDSYSFAEKNALEKGQIDEVVRSLRGYLLQNVEDQKKTEFCYHALKRLIALLPLIKNNNVQARIALETIFIY